jgi:hypothetical protein
MQSLGMCLSVFFYTDLLLSVCVFLQSMERFVGLAYKGKDIVFRFIIEYSSLIRDFGPLGNNRSIFI